MAQIYRDHVQDTTASNGSGPLVLTGASPTRARAPKDAMAIGDVADFLVQHQSQNQWQTGKYQYTALNTLTLLTAYDGSDGLGVTVSFITGTKDVALGLPAQTVALGIGQTALGSGGLIRTNSKQIAENITFSGTENGVSAGPIEVATGFTVTVTAGSTWTIV